MDGDDGARPARSTLAAGRQAYIALDASDGPHVTPELYAWSGGTLWFATATTTLKARHLDGDTSRAAALVAGPGRAVVLTGDVRTYDLRRPGRLAERWADAPDVALAWSRYVARNAADLIGFGRDLLVGALGRRLPPARVLFALEPDRTAVVENDALVARDGWTAAATGAPAALPAGGRSAVVAFPGPFVAPARWFADTHTAYVPPQLLQLFEVPEVTPVGLVVDEYTAPGPAAKQGTLVRGTAIRLEPSGVLSLVPQRAVEWDGVAVDSAPARSTPEQSFSS